MLVDQHVDVGINVGEHAPHHMALALAALAAHLGAGRARNRGGAVPRIVVVDVDLRRGQRFAETRDDVCHRSFLIEARHEDGNPLRCGCHKENACPNKPADSSAQSGKASTGFPESSCAKQSADALWRFAKKLPRLGVHIMIGPSPPAPQAGRPRLPPAVSARQTTGSTAKAWRSESCNRV